jgi:deoxyribonuclease-4
VRIAAPIGAHLSMAGGLPRVVERAQACDATVVQLFATNPRAWSPGPMPDAGALVDFRHTCADAGIRVFVHAPYLINPGTPDPLVRARSEVALGIALERGRELGAEGIVVHAGSAVQHHRRGEALAQAATMLRAALDTAPPDGPRLLVEPTAGGGAALAADVPSIVEFFTAMHFDERLGLCLDTCHLHAAGHDLTTTGAVPALVSGLSDAIGGGRLQLWHANDSRDPADSRRDRHAPAGTGTIGTAPFADVLATGVPVVIETEPEHHAAAIARLRRHAPSSPPNSA